MIFKESNFSEKTAWISIMFTLFMALFYSNGLTHLEGDFSTHADQIVGLWAQTIVVSVIFIVIVFVALSIFKAKGEDSEDFSVVDERDELIEAKATFWGYFNMHFCITILLLHVFCQAVITNYPFFVDVPPIDFLIHGLMYSGLLVEFILRATQIYRYRQGF
jgi:hypothetical protein